MSPAGLPLELQVGLLNPGQRKALNGSRRGFEGDHAVFESGERAVPVAPAFHRIAQADSRLLALKPLIILGFEELAFHPGGTHFERITPARDDIFDIQDGAHLLRYHLAVAMRHALGFIDRDVYKRQSYEDAETREPYPSAASATSALSGLAFDVCFSPRLSVSAVNIPLLAPRDVSVPLW